MITASIEVEVEVCGMEVIKGVIEILDEHIKRESMSWDDSRAGIIEQIKEEILEKITVKKRKSHD